MNATDRQKAGSTRADAAEARRGGAAKAGQMAGIPVRELEHDRRKRRQTAAEALRGDVDIDGTGLHKVTRTFGEVADNLDAATDALAVRDSTELAEVRRRVDDFGRTAPGTAAARARRGGARRSPAVAGLSPIA